MNSFAHPSALQNSAETAPARRVHERFDLEVEVDLISDTNFYTGFSANISEGGIFVETYSVRAVGERMQIKFSLPDDPEPIHALTEVRWSRAGTDAHHAGLGLRFIEIAKGDVERIHAFIQRTREPLFFDED